MNVICPRCGKDNTVPFSDSVYHTSGFECQDCHHDFGVDDGKTLKEWEDELTSFTYEKTTKGGDKRTIKIAPNDKGQIMITPSILYSNKMLQPIAPQDMTPLWEYLKKLFFEKIYILDWNRTNVGFITGKDETFSVHMTFATKQPITITGTNLFPPYLKILDQLFDPFFQLEK